MTPDEIVAEINQQNADKLYSMEIEWPITSEKVLALMNCAGIDGFRYGANTALSMVQGALCVNLAKLTRS